jgi:hypothetical protein
MASKKSETTTIDVLKVTTSRITFHIVGTSPLICNAMSEKARQQLLLPPETKSRTQRQSTLKHDPIEEYKRSVYKARGDEAPTRIIFPGAGFKALLASTALDLTGASKSQIGRLSWVPEYNVHVYGIPALLMSVVRSADMARTPDIRTRAIVPQWACTFSIECVTPMLNEQAVTNLLASGGITRGIGDWRPEKGKGSFGQFRIAGPDDPEYQTIVKSGGRLAQDAALGNPTCYDNESEELLSWFNTEAKRRGLKKALPPSGMSEAAD